MSLRAMTWVMEHSEEKLGRRLVLLALADCAHDDGTNCWPAVDTIASKARMSRRQVQRALKDLEASGAIRRDGASRVGTTMWTIALGGDNLSGRQIVTRDISDAPEGENVTRTVIERSSSSSPPAPPLADPSPVEHLWTRFVAMRQRSPKGLRRTQLDQETTGMVQKALEVGTVEEWLRAIDAILLSPHHRGENDRSKMYLDPRHIFTACSHGTVRQHLDWLLDLSQAAGDGVTSALNAKVRQAKVNVVAAFDLAGSAAARRKGDESREFLAQHGISVVFDGPGGRPRFEESASPQR